MLGDTDQSSPTTDDWRLYVKTMTQAFVACLLVALNYAAAIADIPGEILVFSTRSEGRHYDVKIRPVADVRIGEIHQWKLELRTANGKFADVRV
jgi:hypothetical protein